jgi:hypothetical protein
MCRFLMVFAIFVSLGCSRPDPQPELQDPIWNDLRAQLGVTRKNIEDFRKLLEEHQAVVAQVKVQTGQIKYAEKRVWETKKYLETLYQQEKYWLLRIAERQVRTRANYLKAFKEGKPWPDKEEISQYMAEKRLRQASLQWDSRDRIKDFKKAEEKEARAKTGE